MLFRCFLGILTTLLSVGIGECEETTTLSDMIAIRDAHEHVNMASRVLKNDWIGDVTTRRVGDVEQLGSREIKLRLERGVIRHGEIRLYRPAHDSYRPSEAPVYVERLPDVDEILRYTKLGNLTSAFGGSDAFTTSWSSSGRLHWTVGWTSFTREAGNRLRYMHLFARVSGALDLAQQSDADIDGMIVWYGVLRPADMDSEQEREEYPTSEAMLREEQLNSIEKPKPYPSPLKELVTAARQSDDPDRKLYYRQLNEIRRNPNPNLFRQIVQRLNDPTLVMYEHLEHLLLDRESRLDAWRPRQRDMAIRACLNAMPLAGDNAVVDLAILLLSMKGGGTVEIQHRDWGGGRGVRIEVAGDRYSLNDIETEVSSEQSQAELESILFSEDK